jgi:hypothetical protein
MPSRDDASKDVPVAGPFQTVLKSSGQRSVVALAAAIAGSVLTIVGFFTWILGAIDGTGASAGASIGQVLFYVGLALGVLAIALALWSIVRGAPKLLPIASIAVALAPVLFVLGLQMR